MGPNIMEKGGTHDYVQPCTHLEEVADGKRAHIILRVLAPGEERCEGAGSQRLVRHLPSINAPVSCCCALGPWSVRTHACHARLMG